MPTDKRPEGWTPDHEVIAQALYADTWIEPKDDDPHPDWHHRFQWWQCVSAARLAVPALIENALIDGSSAGGSMGP
jgi:hypothetical protein